VASSESPLNDFGLIIAYLLPGVTALWGVSYFFPIVRHWLGSAAPEAPTIGGFLYLTVSALTAGLTVGTVRWLVLDTLHHRTGVRPPRWDFALLGRNVEAFTVLRDIHYRYYEFNANTLVALIWVYAARRIAVGPWDAPPGLIDVGFLLLACVFFLGSRDTLTKYYQRTGELLTMERRAAAAEAAP